MNNYIFPFHRIEKGSRILLYGAGTIGEVFYKQVKATGYADIVLWVDSNYSKYREKQYPVEPVENISTCKRKMDYAVIAINKENVNKQVAELLVNKFNFNEDAVISSYKEYIFPDRGIDFEEQNRYLGKRLDEQYEIFCRQYIKEHEIEKVEASHVYDMQSLFRRRFNNNGKINITAVKEIGVKDLILAQYYKGDFSNYKFTDLAVRMLAIDEYYKKNDYGFELYRKMQADSGFDWTDRFKKLIKSCEENGLDKNNEIETDRNYAITDGAHRISLALHTQTEFLKAALYDMDRERCWDMDYFWQHGFSVDECAIIKNKMDEILRLASYDYIGVMWPPACNYFDDIINDIKRYDTENVKVLDYFDYEFEKGAFEHFFKAMYHTDILNEAGMEHKLRLIGGCMKSAGITEYKIRVFNLHINNPMIGLNPKNNTPQSYAVKRIKTIFRNRYKNKLPKYEYDVIMHISDNYLQSKFCSHIMKINYDISDYFEMADRWDYVILRAKESRQDSMFPKKFYLRSNSDILVLNDEDREKMANLAYSYATAHFGYEWVSVKKWKDEVTGSIYVDAFMRDFLIYKFEFLSGIYGLSADFAKECMEHVISDGSIKYLPDSDEIVIRLLEYIHKPKKTWYIPYLAKHIKELDMNRLIQNLDTSVISVEQIKKVIGGML